MGVNPALSPSCGFPNTAVQTRMVSVAEFGLISSSLDHSAAAMIAARLGGEICFFNYQIVRV
jgi:hypothetical protein